MRPPLRKLNSQEAVVEAEEAKMQEPTLLQEEVIVAPRQQAVVAGIAPMVVLRARQQLKIKTRGPMKKAKMEVVWAVELAEVVVPKLPVKPQTRQRATSRRLRTEIGVGPEAEVAIRIVVIVAAAAGKITRKVKIKTLGSTSITTWRDLIMKR